MAMLSAAQIKAYAKNAGFTGTVLDDMVGIAFAESGGNTNSHNSTPPDNSYGLWQINMLGSMGAQRRVMFGISNNDQLFDPATNAHAAYVVYKNQGLNAWTTYKNGAYLKHMDPSVAPATDLTPVSTDAPADSASAIGVGFSGVTAALNAVGANIFKGLANSIGIGVALLLLLGGLALLIVQSKQGKQALNTVKNKVV